MGNAKVGGMKKTEEIPYMGNPRGESPMDMPCQP